MPCTTPQLYYGDMIDAQAHHPGGRPLIEIDWLEVQRWAKAGASSVQIGKVLMVDHETLKRRCQEEAGFSFEAMFDRKKAEGEIAIAERLHDVAVGEAKNVSVPSVIAAKFLATVRMGWSERDLARESEIVAQAAATLAALYRSMAAPPAVPQVEGIATVVQDADPASALLALLPEGEPDTQLP